MLKVFIFLAIFLITPLAFGQSLDNILKIPDIANIQGGMTPERVLTLYKAAETLIPKKNIKDVNKKGIPNPVYCGGKCIENCGNKTGYIDSKMGDGCL